MNVGIKILVKDALGSAISAGGTALEEWKRSRERKRRDEPELYEGPDGELKLKQEQAQDTLIAWLTRLVEVLKEGLVPLTTWLDAKGDYEEYLERAQKEVNKKKAANMKARGTRPVIDVTAEDVK